MSSRFCHFCGHSDSAIELALDGNTVLQTCDSCGAALDPAFAEAAVGTNGESAYEPEAD